MTLSVRLTPMTAERYATYREFAEADYAANIARAGAMPEREAKEKARADYDRMLPDGVDTPDQLLWTAFEGAEEVGIVWLGLQRRSDGLHAFGYDFWVREDLRRGGYGRAIMGAAEQICRELGVLSVGLSVFGFNLGAQALYEQMGFQVSAIQMTKRL